MEKMKPRTMKLKLFQAKKHQDLKSDSNEKPKYSTSTMKSKISFNLGITKEMHIGDNDAEILHGFQHFNAPEEFLEKYLILTEIGKGAQGSVFKVIEKETQKSYAAKFYFSKDEELLNLIYKENEILSKLDHKNIIKSFDFIQDRRQGRYVIVTEYFESITLEGFLKECQYDQKIISSIIFQLFESIQYLHQNSIIHRDLNCKNILIDPKTYFIKLIDFGVSRFCHSIEEIISPQGNLKYRVPSIFEFSRNPFVGDLWSAVIVALSVMTKKKITTKRAEQLIEQKEQINSSSSLKTIVIALLVKIIGILENMENKEDNSDEKEIISEIQSLFQKANI